MRRENEKGVSDNRRRKTRRKREVEGGRLRKME